MYLAVGTYILGGPGSSVNTSTDLVTWTDTNVDFHAFPRIGPGYLLLLGMFGDRQTSLTTDGKNFRTLPVTFSDLSDARFGADTWVAVGPGGSILSSRDAAIWNPRSSGTTVNLKGVAYGAGTFVAVGENGLIIQSGPAATGAPLLIQTRLNQTGEFVLVVGGEAGRQYEVQLSDDLLRWVDWITATPGQAWTFSPSNGARFYRAVPLAP